MNWPRAGKYEAVLGAFSTSTSTRDSTLQTRGSTLQIRGSTLPMRGSTLQT